MIELRYPEKLAVERWGDGETYGCCLIFNNNLGPYLSPFYCGYVRFKRAPITDTSFSGPLSQVAVHGGITYAELDTDGSGVYGFDCAHFMDEGNPNLQNIDWLKAEVERMAKGILALTTEEVTTHHADPNPRGKIHADPK